MFSKCDEMSLSTAFTLKTMLFSSNTYFNFVYKALPSSNTIQRQNFMAKVIKIINSMILFNISWHGTIGKALTKETFFTVFWLSCFVLFFLLKIYFHFLTDLKYTRRLIIILQVHYHLLFLHAIINLRVKPQAPFDSYFCPSIKNLVRLKFSGNINNEFNISHSFEQTWK